LVDAQKLVREQAILRGDRVVAQEECQRGEVSQHGTLGAMNRLSLVQVPHRSLARQGEAR